MKSKVTLIAFVLCAALVPVQGHALPRDYTPEALSTRQSTVGLALLAPAADHSYNVGPITIRGEDLEKMGSGAVPVYRFWSEGREVYALNADGEYPYLGDIWTADLDRNGLGDFIVYVSHMGTGIPPDNGVILFQIEAGVFRRLDFETYGFEPTDFRDLDADGSPELVLCSMYQDKGSDGKQHTFWVYTAYRIEGPALKKQGQGIGALPSFVWFTQNPNAQETQLLSEAQKTEYYLSLPSAITAT